MAVEVGTVRACTIAECFKPHFGRGLCVMHYMRVRRHGSLDKPTRRRPACEARGHTEDDIVVYADGVRRCRACQREWDKGRDWRERRYGLTAGEIAQLEAEHGGRCAICRRLPDDGVLRIDHDHDTGKVRGLLCHSCNVSLGLLGNDPRRLRDAADYLEVVR